MWIILYLHPFYRMISVWFITRYSWIWADASARQEPTLEKAWPHLQIVYEFFLRFATWTMTAFKKKVRACRRHSPNHPQWWLNISGWWIIRITMKALKHQAFVFLYRIIQRYPEMAILNERSLKKFSFYVGFCGGFILSFDQLWMSFGGIFSMMYLKITCFVVLPSFTGTNYMFIRFFLKKFDCWWTASSLF